MSAYCQAGPKQPRLLLDYAFAFSLNVAQGFVGGRQGDVAAFITECIDDRDSAWLGVNHGATVGGV